MIEIFELFVEFVEQLLSFEIFDIPLYSYLLTVIIIEIIVTIIRKMAET